MRSVTVAATAVSLVAALAAPSSAAPDRSVTLSRETPTASWRSGLLVGSALGVPALHEQTRCLEPALL